MRKVLVCGGRDYCDRTRVWMCLNEVRPDIVIEGGASGADMLARAWAEASSTICWTFPANWPKHGKAAGPIRNKQMLDIGEPDLVLAFPGGKGTANMIALATSAGVRVIDYSTDSNGDEHG